MTETTGGADPIRARLTAIAGPSGWGKSLALALDMSTALLIEDQGAVATLAKTTAGIQIPAVYFPSMLESIPTLAAWGANGVLDRYPGGVGFDDVSLHFKDSVLKWGLQKEQQSNRYHKFDRFDEHLQTLRRTSRDSGGGRPFVMMGHLAEPSTAKDGRIIQGGIEVPSVNQRGRIEAGCDAVFILRKWPESPDPVLKIGMWAPPANARWATKDRWNVATALRPMLPWSVREYLRQTGWDPGRPPGYEWMEGVIDGFVSAVVGGTPRTEVIRSYKDYLTDQKVPPGIIYWILRDACARTWYAQNPTSMLDVFMAGLEGRLPSDPEGPPPAPNLAGTPPPAPPVGAPAAPTPPPSSHPMPPSSSSTAAAVPPSNPVSK